MTTNLGNEKRTTILPQPPKTSDFIGPDYSYADEMPLPGEVGVRSGDSLDDVMNSVKGVAYYADMIGYGEPSNFLTNNMGNKPRTLGINYFIKTGTTCSNGAKMYKYVNGIPKGDALGKRMGEAMKSAGLPQLRGLAPGMLEDAQVALNPEPIVNAVFGSGYAQCKQVTLPVGDSTGRIKSQDGKQWVHDDVQYKNGTPTQTRWVLDSWISGDVWNATTKSLCPDGDLKTTGCKTEGWKNEDIQMGIHEYTLPIIIVSGLCGLLYLRYKK